LQQFNIVQSRLTEELPEGGFLRFWRFDPPFFSTLWSKVHTYISSQKGNRWMCLPTRYDDGDFFLDGDYLLDKIF